MNKQFYYDRLTRSWWAFMTDNKGNQRGDAVYAHSKEDALFQLGVAYGAHPEKFAQPVSELFDEVATAN